MVKWLPEGLVLLGSIIGGMSVLVPARRGVEARAAVEMPSDMSLSRECGPRSLYLICRIQGIQTSYEEIRRLTRVSITGTSMFDIKEAAEELGFRAKGSKCSFDVLWDHLSDRGHYAILYFKGGHFDPAIQIADGKVRIIDTRRLEKKDCSAEDLLSMGWDETALLLQK